jgi:hypothetical protein
MNIVEVSCDQSAWNSGQNLEERNNLLSAHFTNTEKNEALKQNNSGLPLFGRLD